MILRDKGLIFVHVQKTGGSSVAKALGMSHEPDEKHRLAVELKGRYGADVWDACFKFSFVRNPWDRLVSWWSMIEADRQSVQNGTPMAAFFKFVLDRASTFEEFLLHCDEEFSDTDGLKWIYRNQIDYLADERGALLVDFVGRFESLQADFDYVTAKTSGNRLILPKCNRSGHKPYVEYYSDALAAMVAKRYAADIAAFGYRFGD